MLILHMDLKSMRNFVEIVFANTTNEAFGLEKKVVIKYLCQKIFPPKTKFNILKQFQVKQDYLKQFEVEQDYLKQFEVEQDYLKQFEVKPDYLKQRLSTTISYLHIFFYLLQLVPKLSKGVNNQTYRCRSICHFYYVDVWQHLLSYSMIIKFRNNCKTAQKVSLIKPYSDFSRMKLFILSS